MTLEGYSAIQKMLNDVCRAEGKKMFVEAGNEIFNKYPEVTSFGWNQSNYYFDIDVEDYLRINKKNYEDFSDSNNRADVISNDIQKFLGGCPFSVLENLGDGELTLTRAGTIE